VNEAAEVQRRRAHRTRRAPAIREVPIGKNVAPLLQRLVKGAAAGRRASLRVPNMHDCPDKLRVDMKAASSRAAELTADDATEAFDFHRPQAHRA